jgi:thiol-disulfide isomerase/thioredoxin
MQSGKQSEKVLGLLRACSIMVIIILQGCGAASRSDRNVEAVLRAKKIVNLDKLTGGELHLLSSLVKKEASPCPGSISLFEELDKDKPCPVALQALGFLYRRILDGYPENEILEQYVARFRIAREIKIDIEGRPDTGPDGARVTIVVFSDFQCPFCRRTALTIRRVKSEHPDDVRLVFKHFPLISIHPRSEDAAVAAEAAFVQGRFWEMHDALFALEGDLSRDSIEKAAGNAGLDVERWKEDMETAEVVERVNKDKEEAEKLKLQGTPTIFVNGIEFLEPVKYLGQYVDEQLLP